MAATAEAPAKTQTAYLIFKSVDEGLWQQVTPDEHPVSALSDVKAIQSYVADHTAETTGKYVAIPQRSFRPRTVAVETNPRVRIS